MNGRVRFLIENLNLKPHPEGGYYREVFRSGRLVVPSDHRACRNALTAIYFLLEAGQFSRWHCVLSDEVWCHLEGDPLRLISFDIEEKRLTEIELGRLSAPERFPMHVIPAGVWQAAEPLGEYALVGCYVGPGFDFHDFRLAANDVYAARVIRELHPELSRFL